MRRYDGVITERQGGISVDLTTETLTYDIEALSDKGTGSIKLQGATPNRPYRNVTVTAAVVGDPVLVWMDEDRLVVFAPTEHVTFDDCDAGGELL